MRQETSGKTSRILKSRPFSVRLTWIKTDSLILKISITHHDLSSLLGPLKSLMQVINQCQIIQYIILKFEQHKPVMTQIKGTFGPSVIAEERLEVGTKRRNPQRHPNDPLNFIKIQCKLPKEAKYSIGSTDVFDFNGELQKLKITKYTEILKLENQYSQLVSRFRN